ncbi:salivary cystatin-L2-like [Rhipicephalus sanguineus]|uniref:salivary cystatin-L2-like n=1 Tax=Rhipicephalus sanguineus TaxID=34632 RepID=UPI0020C514A1|nr:salivary cystatin-L2-like [Rhipicephalus sanguineus]
MAAIKPTCMIMLLGVWLGVLLDSGYADSSLTGAWQEQNPHGDPQYLILAHYAVSKQTKGKKMYDTVVRLIRVSTQANKECEAVINVAPTTNARKVVRYSCLLIVFPGDNFNALSAAYM